MDKFSEFFPGLDYFWKRLLLFFLAVCCWGCMLGEISR